MISRVAFETWQMVFPAVGICIFIVVFALVVVRVMRTRGRAIDHLQTLPLEKESVRPASHVRPR